MRCSLTGVGFFLVLVLHGGLTFAQTSPPEHYGVGGFGAVGVPGGAAAVRISVPARAKVGIDLDVGRGLDAYDSHTLIGGQGRWLWRGRNDAGGAIYAVFGLTFVSYTQRTEIRFPERTFIEIEEKTAAAPHVGVGWDRQWRHGTRFGIELTSGGSEDAGPRAFAKVFAVWGRPLTRARG